MNSELWSTRRNNPNDPESAKSEEPSKSSLWGIDAKMFEKKMRFAYIFNADKISRFTQLAACLEAVFV